MNGKSHNSDRSLGSNLDRLDAHEIKPEEFDEIPELTDESVERGRWFVAGSEASPEEGKAAFRKALKRGRPKVSPPKFPLPFVWTPKSWKRSEPLDPDGRLA